uniref:Uncharacterized protein n=1 Tax=Amphimedon queenslandica TaxID=400682 RepID=A0A1X7VH49_AMPQE
DRGLGREEAVIIKSGSCLWLVLHVLAWHKDYNVVLKTCEFTLLTFDMFLLLYALQ